MILLKVRIKRYGGSVRMLAMSGRQKLVIEQKVMDVHIVITKGKNYKKKLKIPTKLKNISPKIRIKYYNILF